MEAVTPRPRRGDSAETGTRLRYVEALARSLAADQRADENTLPAQLDAVDLVVVPVSLDASGAVGDAAAAWRAAAPGDGDRNYDVERCADVVAFPRGPDAWDEYLAQELETIRGQGVDPVEKGFVIIVKKNGRILRRLTGQPPWSSLVGTSPRGYVPQTSRGDAAAGRFRG